MKIAIIGAGSWGTALAQLLGTSGYNVNIWARRPEVVANINSKHINPRYLSDIELSHNIVASLSYEDCLFNAGAVAVVTPSNLMRGVGRALYDHVDSELPIIICSKGVEAESGMLATQVFASELGNEQRLAVLSGPNHAEEIIKGLPAATVIASSSSTTAAFFQKIFATEHFRTYVSDDVRGVEICAAFKNVIAIAVGIASGLGLGDNTSALLMTRGLAEMSRLTVAMGGKALTCMGLAGAGDLIATCTSEHSRNRRFGEMVAQGKTLDDFTKQTHMVVEGALACKTLAPLAAAYDVELPITDVIRGILWEGADVHVSADLLLKRPLKEEFYGLE
ncbi:MAG: NAD(P)-dependent glycerol-3-phosphate dehydrogenase [Eggerthellaceae bacterium]|jgi:glycerol-3-phosphate dehydrogenase (NAD(P)+)|nr:NAD(P)-dependent glycerol-3-phosphate dehydrogenase [Eggerthellaceae bacterium]MCH4220766.1 NAD(P)-dependent glycerol-3-phosphate dehydrogenase [Eggerthellaceae bacterium]